MSNPIENKKIEGNVAQILNTREIVINKGTTDGVKIGMVFKVLASESIKITDPISGRSLGLLDREKVHVKVSELRDKFSICRTFKTKIVGGGPLYDFINTTTGSLTQPPEKVIETLKADNSEFPSPLAEEDSYVKRGDRVIQIEEDE